MEFRAARPQEIPQIRTVLAKALADDPLIRWHFPSVGDPEQRLGRVALYFLLGVERTVLHGRSFVAVEQGRVVGAALWMPPDMAREPSLPRPRDLMVPLLGEQKLGDGVDAFQTARSGAPECEGHYLAQLGLLPELHGSGTGSVLMRHCLEELDGPLWLESANPRNLGFYRRLGFRVVHQAPLFDTTLSRMTIKR